MLSVLVFLPLAGALAIAILLKRDRDVRLAAIAIAAVELALAAAVFAGYDPDLPRFQYIDQAKWLPVDGLTFQYLLAVDGISAPLVLLTGLLGMCAVLVSLSIEHRVKEFFVWLLVLQTAVMGVFTAMDFILFFVFWELELLPMFLLISIWGTGRREYSAMKFLIFTFAGSAFMLVAILAVFFTTGTFDMIALLDRDLEPAVLSVRLMFAFFLVAFAVKLPIWPLHTWLPDAHTDAPTAVSVMLAGVLLKMGGYGLIRINVNMFPNVVHEAAFLLAILAVISILYGAMVTMRQTDLKRLIAYSSISHMGYVTLGIATVGAASGTISPLGLTGAAMQMFTHGTITGLLFVMVGLVYEKAHTRHIPDLGGLASRMPFVATAFVIAGLASLGLPSTSGFVSEVLVFLGAFPVYGTITVLAAFGVVITAGYILWTLQRTLFGPSKTRWASLSDASFTEMIAPALLIIAIMVVGLYPAVISDVFKTGVIQTIMGKF